MIIENLRGIWIPREVLLNEELTDKEKIILAIILYSSEKTISSFVSNKSISNLVNITQERVSKIISSLRDKGYIEVKLNYKLETKEIENRQITHIREKIDRYSENNIYPISKENDLNSYKEQASIVQYNKDIINNKNIKIIIKIQSKKKARNIDIKVIETLKILSGIDWKDGLEVNKAWDSMVEVNSKDPYGMALPILLC